MNRKARKLFTTLNRREKIAYRGLNHKRRGKFHAFAKAVLQGSDERRIMFMPTILTFIRNERSVGNA